MRILLPRFGPLSPGSVSKPSIFGLLSGAGRRSQAGLIETFARRSLQRRALAEMDDFQLADIGVSRSEARNEANKPFWRA